MDVSTYVFFDRSCQQAIDLYVSALGAEVLHLSRFDKAPSFLRAPGGDHLVFHATLRIGGSVINLADDPSGEHGKIGGVALLIHVDAEEEVDRIASALAELGITLVEPAKTMWARRYAVLKDRFGVTWKLQFSGPE